LAEPFGFINDGKGIQLFGRCEGVQQSSLTCIVDLWVFSCRASSSISLMSSFSNLTVAAEECVRIPVELVDSGLYVDALTLRKAKQKIQRERPPDLE